MDISADTQEAYDDILRTAHPNALRASQNSENTQYAIVENLREFVRCALRDLEEEDPALFEIFLHHTDPALQTNRQPQEFLQANKLENCWLVVAKIRFHAMSLMQWLLKAPNVFCLDEH